MVESTKKTLPRHVGIIMDGNGRWARSRNLPRVAGHREGAKTVNRVVTHCRKIGVEALTLFAFSSQNWIRPTVEVQALMSLLAQYVKSERSTILDNGIRLTAIGDIDALPRAPRKALTGLMDESSGNRDMTLTLALSYGGREEIVAAARAVAEQVEGGLLKAEDIDEEVFARALWSNPLGDLDLIIRTSGELRISNFLLWSGAYAELYFSKKMWPEFDEGDLDAAFASFAERQRRFGDIDTREG